MPAAGMRRYVSNGREFDGQDVRIVDPRTCATLPEGTVGEIWISGPCIAGGYWNKAELNREIFMAETPGPKTDATCAPATWAFSTAATCS